MNKLKNFNFWLVAIVFVLFITGLTNAAPNSGKYKRIADSLTTQMQIDMSDKTLNVEITRASEMQISKDKQTLFGDAYYTSAKNAEEHIPMYFEAEFNSKTNKISIVDYTFLDSESQINENYLQRLILKQLGSDYKTDNVVLSIDNIGQITEASNTEKFRGVGVARIGGMVWKQIKFEVSLNSDSEKVIYKLGEM